MSHIMHPRIVEHGLVDGCDRCAQIAADPFTALDDHNLRDLVRRTRRWMSDYEFPRSDTEAVAMRCMEQTLVRVRQLERIAQDDAWESSDLDGICGAGAK